MKSDITWGGCDIKSDITWGGGVILVLILHGLSIRTSLVVYNTSTILTRLLYKYHINTKLFVPYEQNMRLG